MNSSAIGILKLTSNNGAIEMRETSEIHGTFEHNKFIFNIPPIGDVFEDAHINLPKNMIVSYTLLCNGNILDKRIMECKKIIADMRSEKHIENFSKLQVPNIALYKLDNRFTSVWIEVEVVDELSLALKDAERPIPHEHTNPKLFINYCYYDLSYKKKHVSEPYSDKIEQHQYIEYQITDNQNKESVIELPFVNFVKGLMIQSKIPLENIGISYVGLRTINDAAYFSTVTPYLNNFNTTENTYYIPAGVNFSRIDPVNLIVNTGINTLKIIALSENNLHYCGGMAGLKYSVAF
jgi:hypothetical protein